MRLIDADAFKEYVCNAYEQVKHMYPDGGEWARQITEDFCKDIDEQPTIDIFNNSNTLGALDCVERRLVSYKLTDLVNEFEEILSHIREREENDSVCGLCEYDGAYMGQSGDWCNECPGFDKADCFKLKDKYKKEWLELMNTLPSVQPKERCIANIVVSKEDLERIVAEQVEEIKELLPRKGEWTRHFDGNEWYWYCSSCKEQWYEEDLWMGGNSFPNFCPKCGADMREGES